MIPKGALVVALAAALAMGAPAQPGFAGARSEARASGTELKALINTARSARHISALHLDRHVSRYAFKHSRQMAAKQKLFHTRNLARPLKGTGWHLAGENVGEGATVGAIHQAFMHSPDHRANILEPGYDRVAVGVYSDADETVWVTVIFYG